MSEGKEAEKRDRKERKQKKKKVGESAVDDEKVLRFVVEFSGESAGEKDVWLSKLEKFLSLPEEERRKRCRTFVDYLISIYQQKGAAAAGSAFVQMLNTPEGMIYFTYMIRPEFRALVVRAIASLVAAVSKVTGGSVAPVAGGET